MALLDRYTEWVTIGPKQRRQTHHLRPIAFSDAGSLKRIVNDFIDGDQNFPSVVTAAPLLLYTAPDGMRRICPTRDPQVYVEIGAPFIKPAATWQKVSLNPFARTTNRLLSANANVNVSLWMGGHFTKLEFELLGGYVPPNSQVAFPVGLNGLTRTGDTLFAAGVPVMYLSKPVVYDATNRIDVRPITHIFTVVAGQPYVLFTLPSLAGMARPVVDPTLTLQPDGTAGYDTLMYEPLPTTNFETFANWELGTFQFSTVREREVVKFDVSSIPASATIDAATLTLFATEVTGGPTIKFYNILSGNSDWTESGATWDNRKAATAWAGSAGCGTAGTDRSATELGSKGAWTASAANDVVLAVGQVQSWLSTNYGLTAKEDTEPNETRRVICDSSDGTTASQRPKLVIDYTESPAHRPFPILR